MNYLDLLLLPDSFSAISLHFGVILPLDHEVTPLRLAITAGLLLGIPAGIFGSAYLLTEVIIRRRK